LPMISLQDWLTCSVTLMHLDAPATMPTTKIAL
jgi:hypothetical protein